MLYILGVNHSYQKQSNVRFEKYIRRTIEKLDINVLAEEYSLEACHNRPPIENSILNNFSTELHLHHRYCDPNEEERKILGIRTQEQIKSQLGYAGKVTIVGTPQFYAIEKEKRKDWYIRENEWLNRLRDFDIDNQSILMVIGASHMRSFLKLLREKNIDYNNLKNYSFRDDIS